MKRSIAELITRDPEKFAHHDRVFKNNPVVMQGMGLAPLWVSDMISDSVLPMVNHIGHVASTCNPFL